MLTVCMAALALSMGCAGPDVHYDYDARASYQGLRTYDWYAAPTSAKGVGRNPLMDTRVRRAVEAELAARNLRRETSADPDFLVTYYPLFEARKARHGHVGLGLGLGGRGLGMGVGLAAPIGGHPKGQIGSIVLEIQDFKTHTLIWKAVADQVLDDEEAPEDADTSVAQAVRKMLSRFPPPAPRS